MKDQNVTACIKQHKPNEFYVKRVRGGYFAVIDNYDKSMASLEVSEEAAMKMATELNELRNNQIN